MDSTDADNAHTTLTHQGPLAGCVALVTGASSGIGAAAARALAAEGAVLGLVARRAERLEELAGEVRGAGGAAVVFAADLTAPAGARQVVEDAADHFGRLDVVLNNAGHVARRPVEHSDPTDWDRMVDLNLRAVLHVAHTALPHLLRAAAEGPRGVADLVNVSSVAGRVPRRDNSVYSATKHAVTSFTEAMRQEVTARGVRVGVVGPGMTATEMTGGGRAASSRGLDPALWLRPEDVARAVSFMVTQPPHAAVNEIVLRPTAQEH